MSRRATFALVVLAAAVAASVVDGLIFPFKNFTPCGDCISYRVVPEPSWPAGVAACAAMSYLGTNGTLAVIRSDALRAQMWTTLASVFITQAWIGATDQATEGTWQWESTGETFFVGTGALGGASDFAYGGLWAVSEPNNAGGGEDFGELKNGNFNDSPSTGPAHILCSFQHPVIGYTKSNPVLIPGLIYSIADGANLAEFQLFEEHVTGNTASLRCKSSTRTDPNTGRTVNGSLAALRSAAHSKVLRDLIKQRSTIMNHTAQSGFGVWVAGTRILSGSKDATISATMSNQTTLCTDGVCDGNAYCNFTEGESWGGILGARMMMNALDNNPRWNFQPSSSTMPYACSYEYSLAASIRIGTSSLSADLTQTFAVVEVVKLLQFGDHLTWDSARRACAGLTRSNAAGDVSVGMLADVYAADENGAIASLARAAGMDDRGTGADFGVWLGASTYGAVIDTWTFNQSGDVIARAGACVSDAFCNFDPAYIAGSADGPAGLVMGRLNTSTAKWVMQRVATPLPYACAFRFPLRANVTSWLTVEFYRPRKTYAAAAAACAGRRVGLGAGVPGLLYPLPSGQGQVIEWLAPRLAANTSVAWIGAKNGSQCLAVRQGNNGTGSFALIWLDCGREMMHVCYFRVGRSTRTRSRSTTGTAATAATMTRTDSSINKTRTAPMSATASASASTARSPTLSEITRRTATAVRRTATARRRTATVLRRTATRPTGSASASVSASDPADRSGASRSVSARGSATARTATSTNSRRALRRSRSRSLPLTPSLTTSHSAMAHVPLIPAEPVLPVLAEVVSVSEQAVVSTGSAIAASVAAPAAAQTLRAMTLLGVIDTEQRCRMQAMGTDTFASEPRSFPESFFPFISIAGPNASVDARFGLPSRRGAIVANAIIGPVVIFAVAALCGVVRKRFSVSMKDASPLAAGRVLGVTAAVTGSLAMDGVFASAVAILGVPGGPSGSDVALALFGMLTVAAIPVAIGVMMYRVMEREVEAGHPIECVPAVITDKRRPDQSKAAGGMKWVLFGSEVWVGGADAFEQYRPIFASNRGNSAATSKAWTSTKKWRRNFATWSFFSDCLLTVIAATGRGWATTRPCGADRRVQLMQFVVAVFAFLVTLVVQPAISPMRRVADMLAAFVMTCGSFALVVLGAEAGGMVTRCALAAAFLSTMSTFVLLFARRVVLPLRGLDICPMTDEAGNDSGGSGGARRSRRRAATGDGGDLAELLVLPLLAGVNVGDDGGADATLPLPASSQIDGDAPAVTAAEGGGGGGGGNENGSYNGGDVALNLDDYLGEGEGGRRPASSGIAPNSNEDVWAVLAAS